MSAERLLHITSEAALAGAEGSGELRPPSLEEVGFVHLCTEDQLAVTLARHFGGQRVLVVELDPSALQSELLWEESHPGELFPHLYGPLPLAAITRRRWVQG
jgi:uncharacterized protein (DUF952 family)